MLIIQDVRITDLVDEIGAADAAVSSSIERREESTDNQWGRLNACPIMYDQLAICLATGSIWWAEGGTLVGVLVRKIVVPGGGASGRTWE